MNFEQQIQLLGDLDRPLARAELKVLSNLGPAMLQAFWKEWGAVPAERRVEIIQALDALSEDNIDLDFRPVLRACLSDPDPATRAAAVAGLWEDEHERTMDRLLSLIDDESGDVRAAAVISLARFAYRAELDELSRAGAERLLQTLLAVATDPEQPLEVRRRAIEALGYFANSREAQTELGRAYAHSEILMRESAILGMGRSMRPTWFPYIERELKSPAPGMRYEAARAAGELGEDGRSMLPTLVPLVDDDDTEISLAAIWSLGQIGGPNAKRLLQRLARSKDEVRSRAASEALEELALDEF